MNPKPREGYARGGDAWHFKEAQLDCDPFAWCRRCSHQRVSHALTEKEECEIKGCQCAGWLPTWRMP